MEINNLDKNNIDYINLLIDMTCIFSIWIFSWFILFYLNISKLNPSIVYVFSIIPMSYLYTSLIFDRTNDINKLLIFICFTIVDIFPIIYLIVSNNFKLEYKSFILSLGLLLFYLIYIRYLRRDMDNLYTKYLFNFDVVENFKLFMKDISKKF
jgi:hypothetical protein